MSRVYRTIDGDMLDLICQRELGSAQHVPAVLDANPGLAALGSVYAAGVSIALPDVAEPVATGQVRLWGRT
jgi:phage tail protein X